VNNFDTGESLTSLADVYYNELVRAYDMELWNVVVRHAQEVVELSLKGLLKMIGVEYPKSNDVGGVFGLICMEMGFKVEPQELAELKDISSYLADARAPAFYMERIYDKQSADKAKADAEKVLNFARLFAKTLKD
jgi:HEPN domain-containing protein